MRIRLSLVLEVTRGRRAEPDDDPGAHRDLDTLVESAGPQRIGFTVDHGAEPLGPEDGRR